MTIERTLAIIKPDAFENHHVGEIIQCIEKSGLTLAGMKMLRLTASQVERFYYVHNDKYFFPLLCEMMLSGPVVVMLIEGESAISRWRQMIGPTDPAECGPETIRGAFGESIRHNAVHGSDCPDSAAFETAFFFSESELV
ncbi:MAG TPA: nucleoside-diphosphate kinase [Myxococcota bacterium]|nr:nucleoside-diphosphate kinase [Myxococcota bacterium]HOA13558.1 nucleoside-diphosphate kinase [Myxococcota bacterium]HOC98749.1 nucleoside-diphosphate kinase [Myxococcota bacterium]HOH76738.1 nucleoside-diphosphate kinase [Myxococcota bacterium]HPV03824.1 nucleoside-diphosphate kinase [Myxococcota bacterium]